jgi:hypothetical protein
MSGCQAMNQGIALALQANGWLPQYKGAGSIIKYLVKNGMTSFFNTGCHPVFVGNYPAAHLAG